MADNPYAQYAPQQENPYAQYAPSNDAGPKKPGTWGDLFKNFVAGVEDIPGDILDTLSAVPKVPFTGDDTRSRESVRNLAKNVNAAVNTGVKSVTGFDADTVPTNTFGQKFARNAGGALPLMLNPFSDALTIAKTIGVGLGAVGGQTVAQDVAPNSTAAQIAGGVLGGLLTHKAMGVPAAIKAARTPIPAADQASQYVSALTQNVGKTPTDIQSFGDTTFGKPVTGAEALGPQGVTTLASLGRREGATGSQLAPFLAERAEGTPERILGDFAQTAGVDPNAALGDITQVVKNGRIAAKPLYDKAFAGGGTGAFQKPLENAFAERSKVHNAAQQAVADAENEVTLATAKLHNAGDNVYGVNSANQDLRAAQSKLDAAQSAADAAEKDKMSVSDRLKQAQQDEANGVRGGLWSPVIQNFMDDPRWKRWVSHGVTLERTEALEEGRPFNPNEYAIKGFDGNGEPIIGAVPNMRLLDAAKRGMDAEINGLKDKTTGRFTDPYYADRLNGMKNAFLREMDSLNPDYKAARSTASDYLSAQDAFDRTAKMFSTNTVTAKQFEDFVSKLNGTNLEAAKGGAANWLFNQSQKGLLKGQSFSKPILQKKLTVLLGDAGKAKEFLNRMSVETSMAKAGQRMAPGLNSPTFELSDSANAQDYSGALISAGKAAYYGIGKGNVLSGVGNALDAWRKLRAVAATPGMPIEVRNEAGRLLMMHPNELASHLSKAPAPKLRKPFPMRSLLGPAITSSSSSALSGNNQ